MTSYDLCRRSISPFPFCECFTHHLSCAKDEKKGLVAKKQFLSKCQKTTASWFLGMPQRPILQFFLNIVQKPFDSPPFLSFEHLVDNFRPLLGHLLGHYEFCSFLGYGLGMGLDMTPLPFWTMIKNWKIRFGAFLSWKYTSYQSGDGSHHARSIWPTQDEKHLEKE